MKTTKKKHNEFLIILIGFIVILIVAILTKNGYINDTIKCKEIKGRLCSNYEIEKLKPSKY